MTARPPTRRLVGAGVALGVLLLSGCAASAADPAPPSSSPVVSTSASPVAHELPLVFDDGSQAALTVTTGQEDLVAFAIEQGQLALTEVTVDVSVNGATPVSVPVRLAGSTWAGSARLRPGTWLVEVSGTSSTDGFGATLTARTSLDISEATP